jgi:hypothetical protein
MNHDARRRLLATSAAAVLGVAFAALAAPVRAEDGNPDGVLGPAEHVVYSESNDTQNAIFAFRRDGEGNLTPVRGSPFAAGGKGVIDPSFKLGPFDSDQNVQVDRDRRLLFAVNAGSNSIAVFHIRPGDGGLEPVPGSPFPSGGVNPVSVGLRGDQIVIINQNQDPAQSVAGATPSIVTRHVMPDGRMVQLPTDTTIPLPQGSSPSQALTANDAPFVFDAEFLGGTLASYQLSPDGKLRASARQTVSTTVGNAAALPLGLWANPVARQLYVGLVTVSEVGVFTWNDEGVPIFEQTVPIEGKALCWVRTNNTGTRLYTSDTGSKTIDVFDITDADEPRFLQLAPVSGPAAIFQIAVDPTDRFLYVISQRGSTGAPGNALHVLAVDEEDGTLKEVPSSPTPLILVNPNGRPQGVAVF